MTSANGLGEDGSESMFVNPLPQILCCAHNFGVSDISPHLTILPLQLIFHRCCAQNTFKMRCLFL